MSFDSVVAYFNIDDGSFLISILSSLFYFFQAISLIAGFLFAGYFFTFVFLFVSSFFNERIIRIIRDRQFPDVTLTRGGSELRYFGFVLKEVLRSLMLLLPLLLLLLIPPIFFFSLSFILFLFFKSLTLYDVSRNIFESKDVPKEAGSWRLSYLVPVSLLFFTASIPVVNILSPFIAIILLSVAMLQRKQSMQNTPLLSN